MCVRVYICVSVTAVSGCLHSHFYRWDISLLLVLPLVLFFLPRPSSTAAPPNSTVLLYQQSIEAKTATTRKAFYSCILFWSVYANHYKNPIYRRPAGQFLLKVSFWLFQKVLSGSGHSQRYKSHQGMLKISTSNCCIVSESAGLSHPEHPLTSMEILDDDGEQWWCWLRQSKPRESNV